MLNKQMLTQWINEMLSKTNMRMLGACMRKRLGACMRMLGASLRLRLGAKYADVGCKSAETFGCKVCGCWVQVS